MPELGLDGLVDDPEAHDVEPLRGQERGVVVAEPDRIRRVGRALVDHVDAVQVHDAALRALERLPARAERDALRGAADFVVSRVR